MANKHYDYDAIVVGSGITGGWAAKELTEKGLKVLMLERGRNIEHIKDYINAQKEAWDYSHRGKITQKTKSARSVVAKYWGLSEGNEAMWVNDQDSSYTEVKPFAWLRGYHMGGAFADVGATNLSDVPDGFRGE